MLGLQPHIEAPSPALPRPVVAMSSGISAYGGTGACYRFWVSFKECRVRLAQEWAVGR